MPHKHRHDNWRDRTAPQPETESDATHEGWDLQSVDPTVCEDERYHLPSPSSAPKEQHS